MGLSRDARLPFVLGAILLLVTLLLDPKNPLVRIGLLVGLGIFVTWFVCELEWVKQRRDLPFSIFAEVPYSSEMNLTRLSLAILLALICTFLFGIASWPPREEQASRQPIQQIPITVNPGQPKITIPPQKPPENMSYWIQLMKKLEERFKSEDQKAQKDKEISAELASRLGEYHMYTDQLCSPGAVGPRGSGAGRTAEQCQEMFEQWSQTTSDYIRANLEQADILRFDTARGYPDKAAVVEELIRERRK